VGDITLDIVTPRGAFLHETGLDEVVVRRREKDNPIGSEIAILHNHAPLLVSTQECDLRYRDGTRVSHVHVAPGTLEVRSGTLTLLVHSATRM
jgi:F0F1-type ATP synthase epsilon subunit